jgi:hypothetical protein
MKRGIDNGYRYSTPLTNEATQGEEISEKQSPNQQVQKTGKKPRIKEKSSSQTFSLTENINSKLHANGGRNDRGISTNL